MISYNEMELNRQPEAFRTLGSRYLLKTPWRNFRQDQVEVTSGHEITYSYVEVPAAVFIVPLTFDGQLVFIRQYRYPIRAWVLEIPGGSPDKPDETMEAAARRELLEEVGGQCEDLRLLATFYSSTAHLNLSSNIYLATGVKLGQQALEATEILERLILPARQALALVRQGAVQDGQSAYALLLAEPHILALENTSWKI